MPDEALHPGNDEADEGECENRVEALNPVQQHEELPIVAFQVHQRHGSNRHQHHKDEDPEVVIPDERLHPFGLQLLQSDHREELLLQINLLVVRRLVAPLDRVAPLTHSCVFALDLKGRLHCEISTRGVYHGAHVEYTVSPLDGGTG